MAPHEREPAAEHPSAEGDAEPPDPEEQARLEDERIRREAEELASFERRADWWSVHYGGAGAEAGERTRKAIEDAERLPAESEPENGAN